MDDTHRTRNLLKVLPLVKAEDIWSELDGGIITDYHRDFLYEYFEYYKNPLNHFDDKIIQKKYDKSYKSFIALNDVLRKHFFSDDSGIRQRLMPEWKKSPDESKRLMWNKLSLQVSKLAHEFYIDYRNIYQKPIVFIYDLNLHVGYFGDKEVKFGGKNEKVIMNLLYSKPQSLFTYEQIYKALNPNAIIGKEVRHKPIDDNIGSIQRKLLDNKIPDIFIRNNGYGIK